MDDAEDGRESIGLVKTGWVQQGLHSEAFSYKFATPQPHTRTRPRHDVTHDKVTNAPSPYHTYYQPH
jgi:hypothetical protein